MTSLWDDLRYGVRMLLKTPGFTAVAILSLALGIGVNTAVFSVVNAILFQPLPVEEPGRLAQVFTVTDNDFVREGPLSFADYLDFRDRNNVFDELFLYSLETASLDTGDESHLVVTEEITTNYFTGLGLRPLLGRLISPEDDAGGSNPAVVVLSFRTWQNRFGGDPDILGRTIRLNGVPFSVVGVVPGSYKGLLKSITPELWLPMSARELLNPGGFRQRNSRGSRGEFCMGRLKPGVTIEQAQAALEPIAAWAAREFPETNSNRGVRVLSANDVVILPGIDKVLYATSAVVMAMVGLVLLIACANVANLMLARAQMRQKEVAIRLSLGAGRARIVRQLLVESTLLALLAGGAALVLAFWSNSVFNSPSLPLPLDLHIDLGLALDFTVFSYALGIALVTVFLFGLAPALRVTRPDLITTLREDSGRGTVGTSRNRLNKLLVIAQVTLSVVLLVAAGLSIRSLANAGSIDPGFNPSNLIVAPYAVELRGYDQVRGERFYRQLSERVATLPGVVNVSSALHLPLTFEIRTTRMAEPGQESTDSKTWPEVGTTSVSPGYFETMGIALLAGRDFTPLDNANAPDVAIVNEELSRRYWPGESPLGKTIYLHRSGSPHTIIGIARTGKYRTLGESPRPYVYTSLAADYEGMQRLLVRTLGDPAAMIAAIRNEARTLDPLVPTLGITTVEHAIGAVMILPKMTAGLFGLFGILGLALVLSGIFGLISFVTSQRTHEFGIRIALGARPGDLLHLVLRQSLFLTGVGVLVGLGLGAALAQLLKAVLYGVGTIDVLTYAAVTGLLFGVSTLAAYLPASRAAQVDPLVALRYE